jgi:hypothetical protein
MSEWKYEPKCDGQRRHEHRKKCFELPKAIPLEEQKRERVCTRDENSTVPVHEREHPRRQTTLDTASLPTFKSAMHAEELWTRRIKHVQRNLMARENVDRNR